MLEYPAIKPAPTANSIVIPVIQVFLDSDTMLATAMSFRHFGNRFCYTATEFG